MRFTSAWTAAKKVCLFFRVRALLNKSQNLRTLLIDSVQHASNDQFSIKDCGAKHSFYSQAAQPRRQSTNPRSPYKVTFFMHDFSEFLVISFFFWIDLSRRITLCYLLFHRTDFNFTEHFPTPSPHQAPILYILYIYIIII